MTDRIRQIQIQGMRTFADATLDLSPMNVVIGENGSGKSTLVEACLLLRRIASPNFLDHFNGIHGGLPALIRWGADDLAWRVRVEDDSGAEPPLDYTLTARRSRDEGSFFLLENLGQDPGPNGLMVVSRQESGPGRVLGDGKDQPAVQFVDTREPLLGSFGVRPPHPAIARMVAVLQNIDVHLPFDVFPTWADRELKHTSALRDSVVVQSADRLIRFGVNLPDCFAQLRDASSSDWNETMDLVRLGLGWEVDNVGVRPDPGGGRHALQLRYRGIDKPVPAWSLSDGQLTYLAFVALFRMLPKSTSLLVFDEPEVHLHPGLLVRVMGMLQEIAERNPVLLTTHSDALLDELSDPARSVVLSDLDEKRATRFRRPDADELSSWLERYRGFGALRSEGFSTSVFPPAASK